MSRFERYLDHHPDDIDRRTERHREKLTTDLRKEETDAAWAAVALADATQPVEVPADTPEQLAP